MHYHNLWGMTDTPREYGEDGVIQDVSSGGLFSSSLDISVFMLFMKITVYILYRNNI
jgi:hypothetical protein